jgi:hypothetical protein
MCVCSMLCTLYVLSQVQVMMTQIAVDKEEAEAVRTKVEAEESKANVKAAATKEIADDAQRVSGST